MYNQTSCLPILTHVTISGNRAGSGGGGGISNTGNSSPQIQNSIIWGNTATSNGNNIFNNGVSTVPVFAYSLIEGSSGGWGSFGTDGGNNIDADPLFVNPVSASLAPTTAGNYRLTYCSPAIDAGNNAYVGSITTDLDGNPRIFNSLVDLGAYEYQTMRNLASVIFNLDTSTICYGDTARLTLTLTGVSPWEIVYTKDGGLNYDTLKSITNNDELKLSPTDTTIYRFVSITDANCTFLLNDSIRINVLPIPVLTSILSNDTLCSGDTTTAIIFAGIAADFYKWENKGDTIFAIPTTPQTGNFGNYAVENTSSLPLTAQIIVIPQSSGLASSCAKIDTGKFTITVLPKPMLNIALTNDTLCHGDTTTPIAFSGAFTDYEWESDNSLGGNVPLGIQTGNFGRYVVANNNTTPDTANIRFSYKYLFGVKECLGRDTSFSITVLPNPVIDNLLTNDTLCSGVKTQAIVFTGAASYRWVVSGDPIDSLPNTPQTGNFGEYVLLNKSNRQLTSFITVTPLYQRHIIWCRCCFHLYRKWRRNN
jgi:hypothetical protein